MKTTFFICFFYFLGKDTAFFKYLYYICIEFVFIQRMDKLNIANVSKRGRMPCN
ncbi:hypothetical protein HMPREF1218_0106 [Hoylesella pleuritidis F0068]|uniref:Uncharacterized protein n=1 Tax=Hoylesella pleuritidis F0068 TaxID=1081904 RepID=U2KZ21_9BACT|nr:hypothetical protein HMPREF1218_0106 [Hoylesella pleuritidis F0068]